MSTDMRLSGYLAAILDLCKLGGFSMGDEFNFLKHVTTHLYKHIGEEMFW